MIELTQTEREALIQVLKRPEPTQVLIHGRGKGRVISFYARGTRLEARIQHPRADDEHRPTFANWLRAIAKGER